MNDYIIRAIAANDQIRAFAAVTTERDRITIQARLQQRHWDVFLQQVP